jgi:hypothetical protein
VNKKGDKAFGQRLETLGTLAAAVAREFNNVLEPIILVHVAGTRQCHISSLCCKIQS